LSATRWRRSIFRVETWPRLLLTGVGVLSQRTWTFPDRENRKERFSSKRAVDSQRRDGDFAWDRVDDNKPLVYCTLGSSAALQFPARASQFFQMFMDAMAQRPALQGVVTIGNY
jgi:UDP:flavonoid glycosyltransferase YjiC (YdhE family)